MSPLFISFFTRHCFIIVISSTYNAQGITMRCSILFPLFLFFQVFDTLETPLFIDRFWRSRHEHGNSGIIEFAYRWFECNKFLFRFWHQKLGVFVFVKLKHTGKIISTVQQRVLRFISCCRKIRIPTIIQHMIAAPLSVECRTRPT